MREEGLERVRDLSLVRVVEKYIFASYVTFCLLYEWERNEWRSGLELIHKLQHNCNITPCENTIFHLIHRLCPIGPKFGKVYRNSVHYRARRQQEPVTNMIEHIRPRPKQQWKLGLGWTQSEEKEQSA